MLLEEMILRRMRGMRVVILVIRRGIGIHVVRVCMRMHVRMMVTVAVVMVYHDNTVDLVCVPVGVILEREMQRYEQRLQHETHTDHDPEESLHRVGSHFMLHDRRSIRGLDFQGIGYVGDYRQNATGQQANSSSTGAESPDSLCASLLVSLGTPRCMLTAPAAVTVVALSPAMFSTSLAMLSL